MHAGVLRLGTFDAEQVWRPDDLVDLPGIVDPHAADVVRAMDEALAVLCSPDDVLVTNEPLPQRFRGTLAAAGFVSGHTSPCCSGETVEARLLAHGSQLALLPRQVEPYAWLPETIELARRLGSPVGPPPAADAVRTVNSKTWSNELVTDLGLAGAGVVARSAAELQAAVTALGSGTVVIKDPFGVSGRGCVPVASPRVLSAIARAVARQEADGRRVELLVQPWLPKQADVSAHFDLAPDGTMTWRGHVEARAGTRFGYSGSRPAPAALVRHLAGHGHRETMGTVGERLAVAGYHGPVCVDALVLEDGGLVPLLEINARLSMGRLCLDLDRRVQVDGLRAAIAVREVEVPDDHDHSRLADALERADCLLRQGTPGILPLTASTVRPPRGRFVYAVVASSDAHAAGLEHLLDGCLADLGLAQVGGVRAA